MAYYYNEISKTFNDFLLVPTHTPANCTPENVSLKTPLIKFKKGEESAISLNIPLSSAIMQSVSNDNLAIALAREGGVSFIYCSQPIENQVEMIKRVKNFKAGFVKSDSNLGVNSTLKDVLELKEKTNHSTMAITEDATANGKLLGIITNKDYRIGKLPLTTKVTEIMTPFNKLVYGREGISLSEANDLLWSHKLDSIPIVDANDNLSYFVFRKDYTNHKKFPDELLDSSKRLIVGAGINTHDYEERVPQLVEAGADVLCIDSSDGFTDWQKRTTSFIRKNYGSKVKIGTGNVVSADGFQFLVEECDADFVKVGIGGGSICITRETKGIGRGQATAIIEIAKQRDLYFEKTGIYIPVCSDGGIAHDHHITLALAMGADFVMLGRYFARFDESPTNRVLINGNYMKEYWGEGSNRAKNWQRYNSADENDKKLSFEEGVDSYVNCAGNLNDNVQLTIHKIKSTMCNCGSLTIKELQKNAKLTSISAASIIEGSPHDVLIKTKNTNFEK